MDKQKQCVVSGQGILLELRIICISLHFENVLKVGKADNEIF